jgi:hypothetical protein
VAAPQLLRHTHAAHRITGASGVDGAAEEAREAAVDLELSG